MTQEEYAQSVTEIAELILSNLPSNKSKPMLCAACIEATTELAISNGDEDLIGAKLIQVGKLLLGHRS